MEYFRIFFENLVLMPFEDNLELEQLSLVVDAPSRPLAVIHDYSNHLNTDCHLDHFPLLHDFFPQFYSV